MTPAIDLAVPEINEAGGVNGRPVLVVAETRAPTRRPPAGLDELLTKKRVDAIIGPLSSKVALAVIDKVVEQHVVTLLAGHDGQRTDRLPRRRLLLPHDASDALQANALGRAISGPASPARRSSPRTTTTAAGSSLPSRPSSSEDSTSHQHHAPTTRRPATSGRRRVGAERQPRGRRRDRPARSRRQDHRHPAGRRHVAAATPSSSPTACASRTCSRRCSRAIPRASTASRAPLRPSSHRGALCSTTPSRPTRRTGRSLRRLRLRLHQPHRPRRPDGGHRRPAASSVTSSCPPAGPASAAGTTPTASRRSATVAASTSTVRRDRSSCVDNGDPLFGWFDLFAFGLGRQGRA